MGSRFDEVDGALRGGQDYAKTGLSIPALLPRIQASDLLRITFLYVYRWQNRSTFDV
jgi:hypothetical protein